MKERSATEQLVRRAVPPLLVLVVACLPGSTVVAAPTHDRVLLTENVDLIVSHGRSTEQRLFGSFSPAGLNYEVQGDVVQTSKMWNDCHLQASRVCCALTNHDAIDNGERLSQVTSVRLAQQVTWGPPSRFDLILAAIRTPDFSSI
ncbi:hypothetical protein Q1695_014732 [Nippostrongylus brasiliensis]|nr:hypothetical protein Q1695_014732 [Nippostrongylus brasiliensis]